MKKLLFSICFFLPLLAEIQPGAVLYVNKMALMSLTISSFQAAEKINQYDLDLVIREISQELKAASVSSYHPEYVNPEYDITHLVIERLHKSLSS